MINYIDQHNLTEKKVWDLSLKEIDYIYKNLHMNNYVYAALKIYHQSNPPLNKIIKLNKKMIPECMHAYAEKLINLSPYLGNDDPKIVRINYTYYSYELFKVLKYVKETELFNVIEFLTTIAYIPIIAERNDNLNLWSYRIVRIINESTAKKIKILKLKNNISNAVNILANKGDELDEINKNKITLLFFYVIRAMKTILMMCENNVNKNEIIEILENIENNMIAYEIKNDLGGKKYKFNIKNPGQLRYRNTLYLYGGDFFRRINNNKMSFQWYTKDIFYNDFHEMISDNFYLTSMKAIERLIMAYSILKDIKNAQSLKSIINKCFLKLFIKISDDSENKINFIKSNPKIDISQKKFTQTIKESNNQVKEIIYAGEGSRELFLLSSLYSFLINKINFNKINYSKYLMF
jgi:hypothetical protein